MACIDTNGVQELLRGLVSDDRRWPLEEHLDGCDDCRRLVAAAARALGADEPDDASPASLPRGARVGRYVVDGRIGGGAMGVVYAAEDPELHRRVAIKLLRPGGADARLVREAQALARIAHPNVIAVYDVGTHAEHVFLAMEL